MKKVLLSLSFLMTILFVANNTFAQGVTTAAISGVVAEQSGSILPGATVIAVHEPTGTQYGAVSNLDGRFRISNMQVGGPYKITISFIGYQDTELTGYYLQLGQTLTISPKLSEDVSTLSAVEVIAGEGNVIDGNRTGALTIIDENRINSSPTVSRSIADFVRFEPTVDLQEGNDGFAISIAGQNNRYNTIFIDGAVNNDVFGLAGSGTNGGQTGVAPISVDAIEQFQVNVAPFDVRLSGFAGGAINAVTRSGSNNFEGSAYYFVRNQDLAGVLPTEDNAGIERPKLDEFTAETYGIRIGGPIIKDKLFFFVSAELQRDETPLPFNFSTYQGDASRDNLNALEAKLAGFGYDAGGFENNRSFLEADRLLARLDWNINNNHRLMFRISNTSADNREIFQSDTDEINYQNGAESFISNTLSTSLQWTARFGNNFSNKLTLGYTQVRDDRDPTGADFPYVEISDGRGTITFGSEQFSTANLLEQDVFTFTNDFEIYSGSHTITIGTHNEFYSMANLFIPFNFGSYEYNTLNDFLNDDPANFYIRSYSLRDNVSGDDSKAIAEFNAGQLGFYVQDEWQVSDNVKLTGGVRFDIPFFEDTPVNESFNTATLPQIQTYYNLQGARTGSFIKSQLLFSPRFGFNWDINGDQSLQLRGGIGVFTSRVPLVWPGGAYNNNGLNRGTVLQFGSAVFEPNINNQPPGVVDVNNPEPSGDIDLFAENFRVPQVFKGSVALDVKLPWGMIATGEFLYTKVMNAPYYQNVNLRPAFRNLTGADERPFFDRSDEIDDTYGRVILATNTNRGYSYNASVQLQKPFDNGLQFSVAYSYGDSFSIFDGTSSQNSSQWRGIHAVNGRNSQIDVQRSNFSPGSRVIAQASYRVEYGSFGATTLGAVFTGRSGDPYSYIYNDNGNLNREDSRERSLIYVPRNFEESNLIDDVNSGRSAELQWAELNRFIENDPYLRTRRGQYAERNRNRAPFQGFIDLRFLQEFYLEMGSGQRNILQFSVDVFNFANVLNRNWGRLRQVDQNFQLINYEGTAADGTTPQFTYDGVINDDPSFADFDDAGFRSSRYQVQLGVRYIFK